MAKIYGLFGSMTGKLADVVMAVRGGEQIARKYQPVVFNPSSTAQIAQRSKLKMMSQLSAALGSYIAIPRMGNVSGRNQFTAINIKNATFSEGSAKIPMTSLKLTKSSVGLPALAATATGNTVTASFGAEVGADLDKVVFIVVGKSSDGAVRVLNSTVANVGEDRFVSTEITVPSFEQTDAVILAYGISTRAEKARVAYQDVKVLTAEFIATLVTTRVLTESDVTLTETQGSFITVSNRDSETNTKKSK